MCCLFGILDYGGTLSAKQKNQMLSVLSKSCEERGTDATGIAYNQRGQLHIYKRPLPAHRMRLKVPADSRYIMGHTRMATQGDQTRNYNNHPFTGCTGGMPFALAHNGVLSNEWQLRRQQHLPIAKVETDSYVAVQLLESSKELSMNSLKQMAELVDGTYTFTILDNRDNLYFVKGNNPLALYHSPQLGVYLYASTESILKRAVQGMRVTLSDLVEVETDMGDILCIDHEGRIDRGSFNVSHLFMGSPYRYWTCCFPDYGENGLDVSYVEELKSMASAFGYTPDDVDILLGEGLTPEEIEEFFYEL